MFGQIPRDVALNEIWKSKALPKLKVLCWLLMMDRLNMRELMLRKNWNLDSGPDCALCLRADLETRDHLFFGCDFALQCWEFLDIQWGLSNTFTGDFVAAKTAFTGPCFMEVFACAAWNIWRIRNDFIFKNLPVSFNRWKVGFQSDLLLHKYKVKAASVEPLVQWTLSIFV
jgi:hypothetical protein